MKRNGIIDILFVGTAFVAVLAGCSVIDEDLSKCGEETKMDYELELVTNVATEMKTQLDTQTDVNLATTLKDYLGDIFTDYAQDVRLML